jgi:hypothetical protein
MVDVELRERQREDFLIALYELADGHSSRIIAIRDIAAQAGIPQNETHLVCRDVVDHRHCKIIGGGPWDGAVELTATGQRAAESLLKSRAPRIDDETLRENVEVVVRFLLIEIQNNETLNQDDRLNIESDLRSVQSQLQAPTPNRGVIKSGLERVRQIWPTVVDLTQVAAALMVILHGW